MTHAVKIIQLFVISSIAFMPDAKAGFIWSMDDNAGNTVSLTDGGTGIIDFSGSVGAFSVSGRALSKPAIGGPFTGLMKVESLLVTTTGSVLNPLTIRISDLSFSEFSAQRDDAFWIGQIVHGSVTGNAYFDPADVDFGTGGLHIPLGTVTASAIPAFILFDSGPTPFVYGSVPYSMFLQLDVSATGPLSLSFDEVRLVQTPEPSAAAICGIGIAVLGCRHLLRRRRVAAT